MDDNIWEDSPLGSHHEWNKLDDEFTTAGYREGITAGKESALQEGFDSGFAQVGTPLGSELGLLRGLATALVSFLSSVNDLASLEEARTISAQLSNIRFSDIAPRDLEAEQHAREHLADDDDNALDENEEIAAKRKMELLEDELAKLTAGTSSGSNESSRPTIADVENLKKRLEALCNHLSLNWS